MRPEFVETKYRQHIVTLIGPANRDSNSGLFSRPGLDVPLPRFEFFETSCEIAV
jgi:hypothetical protein